jgi:RHS repeat-associated protein
LYYILGDHLGSTSLVVNEDGTQEGYVIYDAYGQVVENTLPEGLTDRLFTGQIYDATIGLYFYNARYYDPFVGQFTQPDSLVADRLDPRAWNRFSYVYGNPTNLVDPTGNFVCGGVCIAAIGIGALLGGTIGAGYAYDQGYAPSSFEFWQYTVTGAIIGGATGGLLGIGLEASVPLVVSGSVFGSAINTGFYVATSDNISYRGLAGAIVSGAIAGGIGTVATPLAVSLGLGTGIAGTFAVNATAGILAGVASAALDPAQDLTAPYIISSGISGGLGGLIGGRIFPSKGMVNFKQKGFPRTWRGVIPKWLGGSAGYNANAAIYRGGSVSGGVGVFGPYLTNQIVNLFDTASDVYENMPISPISPISVGPSR